MIRLNDIKNSLIAGFHGVQEGILEVADKINLKVQETKTLLQIRDLENTINHTHTRLGEMAYQLRGQDVSVLDENPEIIKLLNICQTLHAQISRVRERHLELDHVRLGDPTTLLKESLIKQNIKITRFTLGKKSPLNGCKIKDARLSPEVLILCVIKKDRLIIANGDTLLNEQDSLFLMGPESELDRLITEK